jgi:hypothetical protein
MVRELYVSQIHIKAAARALMTVGEAADLEATMDHMIRMAFPNLIQLRELDVDTDTGTAPQMNLILTSHLSLAPSTIVDLNLSFNDYSLISLITPLFPMLSWLSLTLPETLPPWIATSSIDNIIPPSKYNISSLVFLSIDANFNSLAVLNLVSSTEAIVTSFAGLLIEKGLLLLNAESPTESGCIMELRVRPNQVDEYSFPDLDDYLLRFKHIRELGLGGGWYLGGTFFSKLFRPSSRLVKLQFERGFYLEAINFIESFPERPAGLKVLELDMLSVAGELNHSSALSAEWDDDCTMEDVRDIVHMCKEAGIKVEGSAKVAIDLIDAADAELEPYRHRRSPSLEL